MTTPAPPTPDDSTAAVTATNASATLTTPSQPTSSDGTITLGMRCELLAAGGSGSGLRASLKRYGEVAFIGAVRALPTSPEWFGVRLDKPLGKNDGCVDGERLFACAPLHGAVVRRAQLNTIGDFPRLTTHAASIEHAIDAHRRARDDSQQRSRQQRALDREPRADELVQRFWQRFSADERAIRSDVARFVEQRQQPTLGDAADVVQLDPLILRIGALRDDAAAAATMFLSAYDIRQSQLLLDKLLELVDATRAAFAPRKKFAFRTRAKRSVATAARANAEDDKSSSSNCAGGSRRRSTEARTTVDTTEENDGIRNVASGIKITQTSVNNNNNNISNNNINNNKLNNINNSNPTTSHASLPTTDLDELVYADVSNQVIVIDATSFATDVGTRRDLSFSRLRDCVVFVCVDTSAIRCDDLQRCVVLTGPVWGSIWLERCDACAFVVACRQLRVHQSHGTTFHLRISSHPIIEGCAQLAFGPYRLRYDGLDDQLARIGLLQDSGMWSRVNDFQWHRAQQSPNWCVRDPALPLPSVHPDLAGRVSLR